MVNNNNNKKFKVPEQRVRHVRLLVRPRRALYWAYGSNLCHENMARRCPAALPVQKLAVKHTALVFRGVADVTIRPNDEAHGGLWAITPDCEQALDSFEGVANRFYLKRYFTVKIDNDRIEDVLFYQMQMSRGIMPPSQQYIETIARGYENFGIELVHLDRALAEAWNDKEVTPILRERHIRKGKPRLARLNDQFVLTEDDLLEAGAI